MNKNALKCTYGIGEGSTISTSCGNRLSMRPVVVHLKNAHTNYY